MITHSEFLQISLKDKNFFPVIFDDIANSKDLIKRFTGVSSEFTKFGYDDKYHFIGDLFEIFGEMFFKALGTDNRVGIFNYSPVKKVDDNGVDGFGTGFDGKPATIQIKFRSDPTYELIERDLKQFWSQSVMNYDVDKNTKQNLIIFTNCSGIHWYTSSEVFAGRLRSITGKEIYALTINNFPFWECCRTDINLALKTLNIL